MYIKRKPGQLGKLPGSLLGLKLLVVQ